MLLPVEPETLAVDLLAIEMEEVDAPVVVLIVTSMAVETSGKKSCRMILPEFSSRRSLPPRTPTGNSVLGKSIMDYHPWAIFPPPLTVPVFDVLVRTIGNRQLLL